jgi:xanthine dehydrogenase accessory factor
MDIFALAATLRADRTPFVMATVVASYPPQSVRPGAKAIVRADGAIDGWVGGGCVQPVVRQEAADALADGRPRLVRMNAGEGPPGTVATRHGDVREYPMTCQGEGGIEIYLEPVLAAPRLVLLGHTPVVQSLARLGAELGFEVVVGSASVPADVLPPGVRVESEIGAALDRADATTWVVVGTMGAGDEAALAAAASSDAAYVGLVASRKKARYLLDYVRAEGVPAERLDRVKFPAGLDLGGMSASEIALSIVAEIVQRRYQKPDAPNAGSPAAAMPDERTPLRRSGGGPQNAPAMAGDPVCGLPVVIATARHTVIEGDHTVYFCCPACRAAYVRRQAEQAT